MSPSYRVVIIHGTYGSPEENWFPWLKQHLEADGHKVMVPEFPTPEGQSLGAWMEILNQEVGVFGSDLVMVGHSLGSALILRKLELVTEPIRAGFLVSAFIGALGLTDFDPLNASFFALPFNWPAIRRNARIFRLYNGDNDPYVPLNKGKEIARLLGTTVKVVKGGGHINAAAGYTRFDRLLADIRQLRTIGST